MPAPKDFLAAFGLQQGAELDGYTVTGVPIKHKIIERYRHYSFPMQIICRETQPTANRSHEHLLRALEKLTQPVRTVDSEYGNPYRCTIQIHGVAPQRTIVNEVVVKATGDAVRV
jgi:hypothetical protein